MTRYRAFGLEIDSELALPELTAGSASVASDLRIVTAASDALDQPASDAAEIVRTETGYRIAFAGVGAFSLHPDSDLIEVQPVRGAEDLASLPLLGPVMALWLHLKGDLVLHASAVAWRNSAYAFLGDKGAGKSTTAAALLALGGRLLTDDLLRLRWSRSGLPICEPAYPQVKLTDASAKLFTPDQARALPSPHPQFLKSRYRLAEGSSVESTPLEMICVLSRARDLAVERISSIEALKVCLEQVFVRRYGSLVLTRELASRQFEASTKLVQKTRFVRLFVPDELTGLSVNRERLIQLLEGFAG